MTPKPSSGMSARSVAERAAAGEAEHEFDLGPFLRIEVRIAAAEGDGVRARWESGRELVARRVGKQLPKGLLDQLAEATGTSARELRYRMAFAERYPTEDEVGTAVQTSKSWTELRRGLARSKPVKRKRRATREPGPSERWQVKVRRAYVEPVIADLKGGRAGDYHLDELVGLRSALDELIALVERREAAQVEPEGDPEDVARAEAALRRHSS
jgi:hypothetical protein